MLGNGDGVVDSNKSEDDHHVRDKEENSLPSWYLLVPGSMDMAC